MVYSEEVEVEEVVELALGKAEDGRSDSVWSWLDVIPAFFFFFLPLYWAVKLINFNPELIRLFTAQTSKAFLRPIVARLYTTQQLSSSGPSNAHIFPSNQMVLKSVVLPRAEPNPTGFSVFLPMGFFSWWRGGSTKQRSQPTPAATGAAASSGAHGALEVRREQRLASDATVFEFGSAAESGAALTLAGYCPVSDELEPCRWELVPATGEGAPQFRIVF
jgi:hypothetical protein